MREALVNDGFDSIELEEKKNNAAENDVKSEPAEELDLCEEVPPLGRSAEHFETVETVASRMGVTGASDALRRAKRALFDAYKEQTLKKSRQTLISEHFTHP